MAGKIPGIVKMKAFSAGLVSGEIIITLK